MNRRQAMTLAALFALCGCAGQTAAQVESQVLADAAGIVNFLAAAVPQVAKVAPGLLPPGVAADAGTAIALAKGLLDGLSANTPPVAAASALQRVEGYINQVLGALAFIAGPVAATVPGLAPFVVPFQAAVALLPAVEGFINGVVSPGALSATDPAALAAARATLGVPTLR